MASLSIVKFSDGVLKHSVEKNCLVKESFTIY